MKKERAKPYPELGKDWTIVRQGGYMDPLSTKLRIIGEGWYAFNIKTTERKPTRPTYDEARRDIPKESPYVESWGV